MKTCFLFQIFLVQRKFFSFKKKNDESSSLKLSPFIKNYETFPHLKKKKKYAFPKTFLSKKNTKLTFSKKNSFTKYVNFLKKNSFQNNSCIVV